VVADSSHCRAAARTETPARRSFTARRRRSFNAASGNFRESIFSMLYWMHKDPKRYIRLGPDQYKGASTVP
jgi:hypothetical protein